MDNRCIKYLINGFPSSSLKYTMIDARAFRFRGRPQRTSAIFRGGGGTQLQTFADMRGGGVSGMQTSAFFLKTTGTNCLSNFFAICASN